MTLPPLFSRRKRQSSVPVSDLYSYDAIPHKVRVQAVHIILDNLGHYSQYEVNAKYWAMIVKTIRKEKGVFHLTDGYQTLSEEFCNWLLVEKDVEQFLDGVEIGFRAIKILKGEYNDDYEEAKAELNARFQEAAVGYEIQSGNIIQIDSQIIHKEVVLPALNLLSQKRFAGANDEFLDAHRFFREGDYESCLIECGKSFESVLKVIGSARKWGVNPNDPASKLIAAAFTSGFIPGYMQGQFTALRSVLESGVPTVRNKMSGHGAGGQVRKVDKHLAAYQLHQTAAAIVFLVDHDRVTP